MVKENDTILDDTEIIKQHQEFNKFIDEFITDTYNKILKEQEKE